MTLRLAAALAITASLAACAMVDTGETGAAAPAAQAMSGGPPFVLAAGAPGGVYERIGAAVCEAAGRAQPPRDCTATRTEGSVDNLKALRAGGAGFALTQTDTALAAQLGVGPFYAAGPNRSLRSVAALGIEPLAIVVKADSGIARFTDLKGKRLDPGAPGSGTEITMRGLIASHGWTIGRDVSVAAVPPAGHADALCGGRVDALAFIGAQPNPAVQAVALGCSVTLIAVAGPIVDAVVVGYPSIDKTTIAAGTYPWLTDAVPSVGLQTVLATTEAQPDESVMALLGAVAGDLERFRRAHPSLRRVTPRSMLIENDVLPLHPAAAAWGEATGAARREELFLPK
ncbi:MAG: TAXI family TRAP transporter solute-binding subunit [Alphaproteobacteria bacterium]